MGNTTTERNTIERVLEAIGRETGLTARVLQWQPQLNWHTPARPDALIEIDVRPHAEQFAVEVKNLDRFEILHQLRAFWPRQAKPALLVVAPYITAKVAEQCREMDLYFADTAGNAYIRAPGLHLYVTGKRKPDDLKTAEEGKITNPAGLRVVFALLCKPERLNATYRDIAAAARVALGTIGPVMKELETRRHITPAPGRASAGAEVPRAATTRTGMGSGLSNCSQTKAQYQEISSAAGRLDQRIRSSALSRILGWGGSGQSVAPPP